MLKISNHFHSAKKILDIAQIYKRLKKSEFEFELRDYGAGSKMYGSKTTIGKIVRFSSSGILKCLIISFFCDKSSQRPILELGTNLGICSFVLSELCGNKKVVTIEGDTTLSSYSKKLAYQLGYSERIVFINSEFSEVLEDIIRRFNPEFVFLDGNHKFFPTLRYFNVIERTIYDSVTIVFDDILWSVGMYNAWRILNSKRLFFKCNFIKFGVIKLKSNLDER